MLVLDEADEMLNKGIFVFTGEMKQTKIKKIEKHLEQMEKQTNRKTVFSKFLGEHVVGKVIRDVLCIAV